MGIRIGSRGWSLVLGDGWEKRWKKNMGIAGDMVAGNDFVYMM